jgi:hypothetical protein
MNARVKQRLAGAIFASAGAAFTGWIWYSALTEGSFLVKASLLFPAVFVVGVGLMLFPDFREERIARGEDVSQLQGWKLITPRWWAILASGLLAGVVNYYFLSSR